MRIMVVPRWVLLVLLQDTNNFFHFFLVEKEIIHIFARILPSWERFFVSIRAYNSIIIIVFIILFIR